MAILKKYQMKSKSRPSDMIEYGRDPDARPQWCVRWVGPTSDGKWKNWPNGIARTRKELLDWIDDVEQQEIDMRKGRKR